MLRVGLDMVDLAEVRDNLDHFGQRYAQRILGPSDLAWLGDGPSQAARVAALVAAKEAVIKVLAPNEDAIDWRSLGLRADGPRRFSVVATGTARDLVRASGIAAIEVTVATTARCAIALAVAAVHPSSG